MPAYLLSIDPSSTAIGWAVMPRTGELKPLRFGVIRRPEAWHVHLRLRGMWHDLAVLLAACSTSIDRIVVEVSGKKSSGRNKQNSSTLPIYGTAVGMVLGEAHRSGFPVVTVESDHWTEMGTGKGQRKETRNLAVRAVPGWLESGDIGQDAADAIMLGSWYGSRFGKSAPGEGMYLHLPKASMLYSSNAAFTDRGLRQTPRGPIPESARWDPATSDVVECWAGS